MRMSLLAGVTVAIAAALAVLGGAFFGLDLEGYALIGVAMGAVVALVPDARPGFRFGGYLAGIGVSLVGYAARALLLPDTDGGRAFAAFAVLAGCVVIASVSFGRIPLWSVLAGAATFFGVYEAAFTAAPPEMATTALTALTALLLTSALGFLAASFSAPAKSAETRPQAAPAAADRTADLDLERELADLDAGLDDILEGSR
jgi:hypothetical protein